MRTLCDAYHRKNAYNYHAFLDISVVEGIGTFTTVKSLLSHSKTMKVCCFSLQQHYKLMIYTILPMTWYLKG